MSPQSQTPSSDAQDYSSPAPDGLFDLPQSECVLKPTVRFCTIRSGIALAVDGGQSVRPLVAHTDRVSYELVYEMPRYFFDFQDNGFAMVDDVGVDIPDLDRARAEARLTLRDAIADATRNRDVGTIAVIVRNDRNHAVVRAMVEWSVMVEDGAPY